ncbi:MAG TPA: endonuclease III [Cyanobacteria bacterium UBA8803]|nr:endonuclease III [Cyanobacteria bacterium UBA9273]HBL60775.1 endonuclease III [Cyanobacteria bacterium UBA8803]
MSLTQDIAPKQQQALDILERLKPLYANKPCPLTYETPVQLLLAVIMAAQCTDERVNSVTAELYRCYPDADAIAKANPDRIESILRPLSFFRNKTKNIQATCRILVLKFGGQVPPNIDELVKLPGVARKTATMVLHYAYGIDVGVTVDTHVKRLSQRLGFTQQTDLDRIEKDLMQLLPQSEWGNCFVSLTYHGREVCNAKTPACSRCVLAESCPSAE